MIFDDEFLRQYFPQPLTYQKYQTLGTPANTDENKCFLDKLAQEAVYIFSSLNSSIELGKQSSEDGKGKLL